MSSTLSESRNAINADDSRREHPTPPPRSHTEVPANFVFGPTRTRSSSHQQNGSEPRYTGGIFAETSDSAHALSLLEQLSTDLGTLLNRVDISDCFLNVKGTYMAVHKSILAARSNAFAAVISGDINRLTPKMREQLVTETHKDKLIISINRTEPEIMKQVVIYMYTAKCDLNEGNAYDLLDAAGRYDIKGLKVHTGRFLSSRINSNNVLMLLKAAYRYQNTLVKQRCIEYFINHAKEIMDVHELWKQFAQEQQIIVAELLHWLVNKDLFYSNKPEWEAASRWP